VIDSDARYPIGRFQFPETVSPEEREAMINRVASVRNVCEKPPRG